MPGVPNPAEGGIFRSEAQIALPGARDRLAQAQAAVDAANASFAEHAAEMARLEALETDRLLSVKQKELRSKVQAGRARISAAVKFAAQLETDLAALQRTWSALANELRAFESLGIAIPDFGTAHLQHLLAHALYRAAIPGAPAFLGSVFSSDEPPFSEALATIGNGAVDQLADALGIIPKAATT